ncbi:MAG: OmpA family protein [Bacteroidales bacterium]|nr:OmpA family protein [Bacteroidales bacterium]
MKASSGLFAVSLILWSAASTYWYVCKINKDCDKQQTEISLTENKISDKKITVEKPEEKTAKDTVSIVNELTEKLKNGYTLYNFPKNSAVNNVDNEFKKFAKNLKIYFSKNKDAEILITGYTDNTGTPKANLYVGKKRAEFLKIKLSELGIDKNIIKTTSKGQNNPVADNNTEEGRNKNRRAVITIINKQTQ